MSVSPGSEPRRPPRARRDPLIRVCENERDDNRLSAYRWRTTWTATPQGWSPDFTTIDDHINRRFYSSCHILQVESPALSSQSSTHNLNSTPQVKEEEGEGAAPVQDADARGSGGSAAFFSPSIRLRRRRAITHYLKILAILWVSAFSVLPLYWGVLENVNPNLEALKIAVVSFDGQFSPFEGTEPIVGNAAIRAVQQAVTMPNHLGYMVRSPADFMDDPMEVRRWVSSLAGWGAIVVNNNASALLRHAVETGDTTYDPSGAGQIIYEQARDLETINQYIAPALNTLSRTIVANFGTTWAESVLHNKSLSLDTYNESPQAVNPAIGFSIYNLRPFGPPAAISSVTIGLIYLIIIAFFSFSLFLPVHLNFAALRVSPDPPLKFSHLVVWRWCTTVFSSFCLSLAYSLVSLCFHVPFDNPPASPTEVSTNPNPFGARTFPIYWMINFLGMTALGLACENIGMLIGSPWVGLFLIFWVISNVATGFYALELAPTWYRWGYVWPLHSVVEASRTVLFDTQNMLGRDVGVLICWCILGTAAYPWTCKVMMWRMRMAVQGQKIMLVPEIVQKELSMLVRGIQSCIVAAREGLGKRGKGRKPT